MSKTLLRHDANKILGLLTRSEAQDIMKMARLVDLPAGKTLYVTGERISRFYFVTTGLVSLIGTGEEEETIGLGLAGNEGVIGCLAVLERPLMPFTVVMMTKGSALQIPSETVLKLCLASESVRKALLKSINLLFGQVILSAVCNSAHSIEQRLSRWLLLGFDLCGSHDLRVTQQDLAVMLGVARPTISLAVANLAKSGLIGHRRGIIRLLDRNGLGRAACSCYRSLSEEYGRFFGLE